MFVNVENRENACGSDIKMCVSLTALISSGGNVILREHLWYLFIVLCSFM